MDKTVNVVEQLVKSGGVVFVGIGLLFILIAIVVGVFKQTWLIAGVNTMPKEKLAKMDLDYVAKYFGLFFGIFGGMMISGVLICTYLNVMNYFHRSMPIAIVAFCAFIILYFNVFKRKRIYNKKDTNQTQPTDEPAKLWHKFRPAVIAILALVPVLIVYTGYREPKVEFDSNAFKLKGRHGVNIPFEGISKADTVAWREMPAISMRTNGISLFKVKRGKFRTTGGDKIHLSVRCGVSPIAVRLKF